MILISKATKLRENLNRRSKNIRLQLSTRALFPSTFSTSRQRGATPIWGPNLYFWPSLNFHCVWDSTGCSAQVVVRNSNACFEIWLSCKFWIFNKFRIPYLCLGQVVCETWLCLILRRLSECSRPSVCQLRPRVWVQCENFAERKV